MVTNRCVSMASTKVIKSFTDVVFPTGCFPWARGALPRAKSLPTLFKPGCIGHGPSHSDTVATIFTRPRAGPLCGTEVTRFLGLLEPRVLENARVPVGLSHLYSSLKVVRQTCPRL